MGAVKRLRQEAPGLGKENGEGGGRENTRERRRERKAKGLEWGGGETVASAKII